MEKKRKRGRQKMMKGIGGIETENWYVWYERGEKERKLGVG